MSNYLEETLENLPELAKLKRKENDVFYKRLKRGDKKALDKNMQQIHEEVFACTDCLQCANCCKTTGPLLTKQDIERLAKRVGDAMKSEGPPRFVSPSETRACFDDTMRGGPVMGHYVGIDLHRRRSVIVVLDEDGEELWGARSRTLQRTWLRRSLMRVRISRW